MFGYSDEEGAQAFELGEKVAPREIERRRKKLMAIQKQISRKKKRALVGQQFDVLLQGPSEETELLWEGRTAMHAPEIDGTVYVNDFGDREDIREGEFYRCEITEAHDYDLVAQDRLGSVSVVSCRLSFRRVVRNGVDWLGRDKARSLAALVMTNHSD